MMKLSLSYNRYICLQEMGKAINKLRMVSVVAEIRTRKLKVYKSQWLPPETNYPAF
jgi:hypothetical protein